MKFFSRELCEKLQALGCVSESGFYWVFADWIDGREWVPVPSFYKYRDYAIVGCDYDIWAGLFDHRQLLEKLDPRKVVPAFTELDFLGTSETASENCRKIWGEESKLGKPIWLYHRHAMLDSPDGEEYIERSLK